MPLTDVALKAFRPQAGIRFTKSDGGGLVLDITPAGVKTWSYRYRLNGTREKVVLGRYPDLTLKAARQLRDKLATQVAAGNSPAIEKKLSRSGVSAKQTLRDFGDKYFKEQVEGKLKSAKDLRRYLDAEIYPALGNKPLRDVNALDVQDVVYRKRDHGRTAAAMRIRMVIKQVFDYAIEKQLVSSNPASMVATRYIGKMTRRNRNLRSQEIREYINVVYRSNIRRQFKLALHLILLTLVRKSMILLARWSDIDFGKGEWTIPAENMKGKRGEEREHVVYLSGQAQTLFLELQRLAGDSQFVLPGRNQITRPFAKNALNKALDGLTFEMEHFTIHDLRRTASTQLREHGWNEDVIEKALSHEKRGIAGIYNRAEYAAERKRMLQWWADHIESIMTEPKPLPRTPDRMR